MLHKFVLLYNQVFLNIKFCIFWNKFSFFRTIFISFETFLFDYLLGICVNYTKSVAADTNFALYTQNLFHIEQIYVVVYKICFNLWIIIIYSIQKLCWSKKIKNFVKNLFALTKFCVIQTKFS